MIELFAALVTGIATVVAAILSKSGEKAKAVTDGKTAGVPDQTQPLRPALPVKNYVWLFVVGAIAGAILIRIVAQAAESGLNSGGYKVPVGTIVSYWGSSAPEGWLLCDGREVPSQHDTLRRMVGERTPDLRGQFLRGLDTTGKTDPEGARRTIGSPQVDILKKHTHKYTLATRETAGKSGAGSPDVMAIHKNTTTEANDDGGEETRPKNIAVNFIIKH